MPYKVAITLNMRGNSEETTTYWIAYMIGNLFGIQMPPCDAYPLIWALAKKIPLNYVHKSSDVTFPPGQKTNEAVVRCQEIINTKETNMEALMGTRSHRLEIVHRGKYIGEVTCVLDVAEEWRVKNPLDTERQGVIPLGMKEFIREAWHSGWTQKESELTTTEVQELCNDLTFMEME